MKKRLKNLVLVNSVFVILNITSLHAQVSLVLDGSFEDTTELWQVYTQKQCLKSWNNVGNIDRINTLYYFSSKRTDSNFYNYKLPTIGYYGWFKKYALIGNAAIGSRTYLTNLSGSTVRSCNKSKLISKLIAGKQYCATLFVVAEKTESNSYTNGLAMYFDNGQLDTIVTIHNDTSGQYTFVQPQVQCQFVINDTTNWQKVQGSFIANGTEEYITIGNFIADSALQIQNIWSIPSQASQVLIDNVSLIPLDLKNWLQDVYITAGDSVWVGLNPLDIPDAQWHQNTIKTVPFFTGPGFWYKPIEGAGATFIQGVEVCGAMVYDTMQVHVVPLSNYELGILNYELRVYPNPAKDVISVEGDFSDVEKLKIYNYLGQEIECKQLKINNSKFIIETAGLPRGLYYVKGKTQVGKVVLE
jgi:hypothetical protein